VPALLPQPDPDGLLEYSVVYTDRALNHMSRRFQGVMNDISRIVKTVYNAKAAIVVPGSGTFRHGSRRPSVCHRQEMPDHPQRLVQLSLDADPRHGADSLRKRGHGRPAGRSGAAGRVCAAADRRRRRQHPRRKAGDRLRAARRNRLRLDAPRRLPARHRRRRSCRRWPLHPRLRRLRYRLGGHGRQRRRRTDQRTAERLERLPVLRAGGAWRARACAHRRNHQQQFCLRPQEVAADHGGLRERRFCLPRDAAHRRPGRLA
jgi:hypothetical protein